MESKKYSSWANESEYLEEHEEGLAVTEKKVSQISIIDDLIDIAYQLKAQGFAAHSLFLNLTNTEPTDPQTLEYIGYNLDLFLETTAKKLEVIAASIPAVEVPHAEK